MVGIKDVRAAQADGTEWVDFFVKKLDTSMQNALYSHLRSLYDREQIKKDVRDALKPLLSEARMAELEEFHSQRLHRRS